jgi:hypothetical protein
VGSNGGQPGVTAEPVFSDRDRSEPRPPSRPRGGGRLLVVALAAAGAFLAFSTAAHAAVGETAVAGDAAATAVAASTPAPAQAVRASATAVPAPEPLVSPRYQAKIADTGAETGPTGPAADPCGGGTSRAAAGSDLESRAEPLARAVPRSEPAPVQAVAPLAHARPDTRRSPAALRAPAVHSARTWYQAEHSRYQLRMVIFQGSQKTVRRSSTIILAHKTVILPRKPAVVHHRTKNQTRRSIMHQIHRQNGQSNVISAADPPVQAAPEPQTQVTDARRLLQLGLVLGFAYVVFLVCWFSRTRDRPHGVGRVVRF